MTSDDLRRALVAAIRPHLADRFAALTVEPSEDLEEAIDAAESWLDGALGELLDLPFEQQRRSPLELFQEAMRFPTEALRRADVTPLGRDPVEEEALPGDLYRLAPASSQDLGEAVWRAHLAWGAAKAQTMVRPRVGLLSADLMDRSRVEGPVVAAGFELVAFRSAAQLEEAGRLPLVVFVDLTHDDADAAIRRLADAGVRVIGFGPHVDDLALIRARSLGASDALPRSRFFSRVADLLPTLA